MEGKSSDLRMNSPGLQGKAVKTCLSQVLFAHRRYLVVIPIRGLPQNNETVLQ